MRLKEGDEIVITYKVKRKVFKKQFTVVSAGVKKNFIVVTNGIYNETIDKLLLKQGKIKIQLIKRNGVKSDAKAVNF
jgi:hypothetical protein